MSTQADAKNRIMHILSSLTLAAKLIFKCLQLQCVKIKRQSVFLYLLDCFQFVHMNASDRKWTNKPAFV